MRPAVVLAICGAALVALMVMRNEQEASFENRYTKAEQAVRAMAQSIDAELAEEQDPAAATD